MVRSEKETPILSRNRRGAFWRGDAYLSARRGEARCQGMPGKSCAMPPSRMSNAVQSEHLVPACYRDLFPITRDWTYLQNASIGPLSTRVLDAVQGNLLAHASAGTEARGTSLPRR